MTSSTQTAQMFSADGVQRLFSPAANVQRMLDVEAALAAALASADVIPASAVPVIQSCCVAEQYDLDALVSAAAQSGNLAIPLVKALTRNVANVDADAARYVHWGATSQDVIDSGRVLQLRDALDLLTVELAELADALAGLAHRYRTTPMMGRTWLQHALPITFGLKAAGWLDAVLRHQQRLHELRSRLCVLQFGGAAGTLASLGDRGMTVAHALGELLDLPVPAMPWHAHRDRMAECATVLGLLTGTLGKIARDVSLMNQTEIAELSEPVAVGRGGSSAMPHKRNPVACAAALTAAIRVPGLVATLLSGMPNEHERALGGWQAEWDTVPEIASLCSTSLLQMRDAVEGLGVDTARMRANMDATQGLVMAEPVSLALAAHVGRAKAHEIIEAACHTALDAGQPLAQVLLSDSEVAHLLGPTEIARLLDPVGYTGEAAAFVDRVLAAHRLAKV